MAVTKVSNTYTIIDYKAKVKIVVRKKPEKTSKNKVDVYA